METIYYTTKKRYIRPKKIVNLMEYKRSLEQDNPYLPAVVSTEPCNRREYLSLQEPDNVPVTPMGKIGQVMDMLASAALVVSALAAIYVLM